VCFIDYYHLKSDQAKKRASSAHDHPPGTRHELAHDTAQAAARAPKWKVQLHARHVSAEIVSSSACENKSGGCHVSDSK
jgi:hypothetical protein